MQRNKIHPDGPVFSRIIAGAWRWHNVSSQKVEELIKTSIDYGITTFDHADIYGDHGNEEIFGHVLKLNPSLRSSIELVTKCGIKFPSSRRPATWVKHYDTSYDHILWSVDNSLKMLNTDHLDLLLIHRPDPLLNPSEVAEAFGILKASGKVLHFGVSNFTIHQFEMLQSYLPFPLVTNQIEISLACLQPLFDGTLDVLMKHRVSPMAWSPLGGGQLMTTDHQNVFSSLKERQGSDAQLALSWLLQHPSKIFPVIGTTKPERIIEAAAAVNIQFDRQTWFQVLKQVTGRDVP